MFKDRHTPWQLLNRLKTAFVALSWAILQAMEDNEAHNSMDELIKIEPILR